MAQVLLCNEFGDQIGVMERTEAHTAPGSLHKAFSVYVFRSGGKEILIQKRTAQKLFGLLYANTCCSHQYEGEEHVTAGQRRLQEECGIACPLRIVGSYVYRADDPEGKGVEFEHVTMLRGDLDADQPLVPHPDEIAELKWMNIHELQEDIAAHPEKYAPWFRIGLPKALAAQP